MNADRPAQKSAVTFAKTGRAVYHSHHDLLRFWERLVRRAGLPIRLTRGFNPHPRLVFPHALGLGIISRVEVVEIELDSRLDNEELRLRLDRAAAGVLEILEARSLPPAGKSRQVSACRYRLSGWRREDAPVLARAAAELLARKEIRVERGAPDARRLVDIRPYLREMSRDFGAGEAELEISHSPSGSARPDEVAKLLAAAAGLDWRDWRLEKIAMALAV
ncbi:MAG: TIGR03936 family radical SAM-associated protein [Planctomycetota bacterium]|nr:TIGR03936 family radical SAM-associated protein [Planctomycetota bacterium]